VPNHSQEKTALLAQLARQGISSSSVLTVIAAVPRSRFVPRQYRSQAWANRPLPIGRHQTISQPYIVAFMTQELHLAAGDKVLEIGTGSGYQTAILARLAREVYTVERIKPLQQQAKQILQKLNFTNIHFRVGDGSLGWPCHAPYQAILVTAAAKQLPPALVDQLDTNGRLIIPQDGLAQRLMRYTKAPNGLNQENLGPVAFVPLITDPTRV